MIIVGGSIFTAGSYLWKGVVGGAGAAIGILFSAFVWVFERYELWEIERTVARKARSLPILVFLGADVMALGLQRDGRLSFYVASAGIIPVVLLVVAMEQRAIRRGEWERTWQVIFTTVSIVLLTVGEGAALVAIERGEGHHVLWALCAASLVSGFVGVVLLSLTMTTQSPAGPTGRVEEADRSWAVRRTAT